MEWSELAASVHLYELWNLPEPHISTYFLETETDDVGFNLFEFLNFSQECLKLFGATKSADQVCVVCMFVAFWASTSADQT